ncbi:hypothetical protein M9H77_17299 [Catharanthus roseus]|uniref:Uncharacterized protein n=1 Tax=Catharanthus roseus TaxID=4058 RepID=A0ACC0B491_CATRO|nr:hypothetical protein M9H77_17299 [Catharanthus roseus]
MESKRKQEMACPKLIRDICNFYIGGSNGVNAYGGRDHRNVNFTPRRYIGTSNEDSCDLMGDKNIEKESIEIEDKDRVEEKEGLVEELCSFDFMIHLEHSCTLTSMLGRNHTMEFEDQEESYKFEDEYDMTMDRHEFLEGSSSRVRDRRMVEIECYAELSTIDFQEDIFLVKWPQLSYRSPIEAIQDASEN